MFFLLSCLVSVYNICRCCGESTEYGYFFNGIKDHLSFAIANGDDDFPKFSAQLWFKNIPKDKFGNLEQCILSHGSWEERY